MENGHHRGEARGAMEKGATHRGERAQSAQAQSPGEEGLRNERTGQGTGQEGMKPREQGKAAQRTGEHAQQAQTENMNGEHRAGEENGAHSQGVQVNHERGAAAAQKTGQANQPGETEKGKNERTGQAPGNAAETEKGKTAAEGQTPANEHRAGEAQTGRNEMQNNRQGEEQHAQATGEQRHVSPQNAHVEGNAHLSNERASRIADTLLATATPQNVNVNVAVGTALPGDVRLMPLPPTVVDLVPECRDYDYVVVNGEIVIVQPSTRHVVEVINTGGGEQAMAATHVNPCGP
jgi:Protein of unknown function (DUF1236)